MIIGEIAWKSSAESRICVVDVIHYLSEVLPFRNAQRNAEGCRFDIGLSMWQVEFSDVNAENASGDGNVISTTDGLLESNFFT